MFLQKILKTILNTKRCEYGTANASLSCKEYSVCVYAAPKDHLKVLFKLVIGRKNIDV